MALKLSLNETDVRITLALRAKNSKLMDALVTKMTYLMTRLQQKAQANVHSRSGNLAAGITNPRAHEEGLKVVGELDWGRGESAPYAQTVEDGYDKQVAINPLKGVGAYRGGFAFGAYRPAHEARRQKSALMFYSNRLGKKVFADFVFRPPIKGQHFMANAVAEMKAEFVTELKTTVLGVMNE